MGTIHSLQCMLTRPNGARAQAPLSGLHMRWNARLAAKNLCALCKGGMRAKPNGPV